MGERKLETEREKKDTKLEKTQHIQLQNVQHIYSINGILPRKEIRRTTYSKMDASQKHTGKKETNKKQDTLKIVENGTIADCVFPSQPQVDFWPCTHAEH